MNKKLRWITETAIMLALLVALQALTNGAGKYITGSCVNMVLAVTVLVAGLPSGLTVALISPVLAYLLGIASNIVTVPAIMVGNATYVTLLYLLADRRGTKVFKQLLAWLIAAVGKFVVLYALVVWLICGVLGDSLVAAGVLKGPALGMLSVNFSWLQLIAALIGGGVALPIVLLLRKALKKDAL